MDEIVFSEYEIICETEDCPNGGHRICIEAPDVDPNFICGVCGNPITNVTKLDTPPNSVA